MSNIVVGTGPVGQIMALSLSRHAQPVTLIGPKPSLLPNMAFAIHPKHLEFLNMLGISPRHQKIHELTLDFSTPTTIHRQKPFCHIIYYNDLLHSIATQIQDIPHITDKAVDIRNNSLYLETQTIPFKSLIAADGRSSLIRKKMGIETAYYRYKQYAHTAIITHTQEQKGISQTFRSYGTFGQLTLSNPYQSAIIWSCDELMHNEILQNGLRETIEKHISIDNLLLIEHHQHIELTSSLASTYHKNNVFLVGSALHHPHPLAGIGFNLALTDIQTLTQILAFNQPSKFYSSQRKRAHVKAHWLTHKIATSRMKSSYYPIIDSMKNFLTLNHIQDMLIMQIDDLVSR
jgi:2-polyprenyl-6-methoxyphenol hydroxylase-like FAD-dependent oxidoreductase